MVQLRSGPEVIKKMKFFIFIIIKKKIKKFSIFQPQISLECFFLLINVEMPNTVGILTFKSQKNFMLSWVEHEYAFITSGPGITQTISLLLWYASSGLQMKAKTEYAACNIHLAFYHALPKYCNSSSC